MGQFRWGVSLILIRLKTFLIVEMINPVEAEKINTAFGSTSSTEFVFNGENPGLTMFKSSITTNKAMRIPTHRPPTHPGEMLREEFLIPMNLSQRDLATAIHVPYQRINELVNQKRGVTPSTALRLAKFFGISADFWLNLQVRWDLYRAQVTEAQDLDTIEQFEELRKPA